jgi:hypothetical protein
LKSGFHAGSYISTTRDLNIAKYFATNGGKVDGCVYVIDVAKFSALGIVACEFPNPRYPDEQEVSILSSYNGEIDAAVIVETLHIKCHEYQASYYRTTGA